ncbi:phospholipase D-like domain-containing protein DpdK [Actinokineospora pegani]|uniref:phospholipase D-like domain-containing protein DpdK n=1 Tax=Actinokineospora pegani TaxID=2654637 RepID=UPI0018D4BBDC|nr:phospholipase D-like domain-containing protein DpdK [Actinokineospora pegani]
MTTRLIHRQAASPSREIAECLEGMLLSELLSPGRSLLVMSPWMSDFPVVDNRGGRFTSIEQSWTASLVPFSAVLRALLVRRVEVRLACGPGDRDSEFAKRVERGAQLDGTSARLSISPLPHSDKALSHEKALVADTWAIYGSMNLTYRGVTFNGELITVTTDLATVTKVGTELRGVFA